MRAPPQMIPPSNPSQSSIFQEGLKSEVGVYCHQENIYLLNQYCLQLPKLPAESDISLTCFKSCAKSLRSCKVCEVSNQLFWNNYCPAFVKFKVGFP